ncbi:heme NO-binding domain-containing protein [Ulvibacter litoralis]|uniref:Haem-NO-binding n=1 Tax=Ulvibacter litoralis TaxID=227084 RepID=A0A1G7CK60_9FLAO|nr:heme NO-binding domain-containing protein [Ulvibacter litoralis]GHC47042.1 guanylate cyclase [Ulvibacter litoralis]SDE39732.1 Haem-NO-binding [Ulvibacter litoralis]
MKGILFTEFLQLVEDKYGLAVVDELIQKSELSTDGAYTAVGRYEFSEMLSLLHNLSQYTKLSIDDLLLAYAEHFFIVLKRDYLHILEKYTDPLEMLSSIEGHIHVEVLKIYPDADLPKFQIIEKTDTNLIMIYSSSKAMYSFGLGLMHKTFEYFNANATIEMEKIKDDGTEVKFVITKNG